MLADHISLMTVRSKAVIRPGTIFKSRGLLQSRVVVYFCWLGAA